MWLERFGDVDVLVLYIFSAFCGLILLLGIIAILVPCCIPHVNAYAPGGTMDFNVIIGGRLLALTILIRGIKPVWASESTLRILCQFYPAALLIGLTLFIGGLTVKGFTIYFYKWYKKPSALTDEWKPNLAIWGLLIATGVVSVVWCMLFTPHLTEVSNQEYICYNRASDFEWKVGTSVVHATLLLFAVVIAPMQFVLSRSRNTPCSPESTALSIVVVNTLLSVVAGLCVYFLYPASTTVMYAITGGIGLWMILFADVAMLTAKVIVAKKEAVNVESDLDDDERYDVIKEEAVSGETKGLSTKTTNYEYINMNRILERVEAGDPDIKILD
ncbi:hypothetical protein LSH36_98g05058 [Paralvinella palmiformis]|uniref:G-protein coupled receptors family 3 profile domain-containing protein n=1 Tax=Paralvinella palmiformis TaxID=53620 RepID=A0AAD9K049_9ANNE|nr:hypothetical protein LSH36_98g05058 [Paralvinella palmiformis]